MASESLSILTTLISAIVGLAFWVGFIFVCIFGRMRWAAFMALLALTLYPVSIALLMLFAYPPSIQAQMRVLALIPMFVGVLFVVLAIAAPFVGKRVNPVPPSKPFWLRWLLLAAAIVTVFAGLIVTSLVSSGVLATDGPSALGVFVSNVVFVAVACVILFFMSRMNSPIRPNVFRWVAFFFAWGWIALGTMWAFLLMFMPPFQMNPTALFCAALMALCQVPPALLMILFTREYVGKPAGPPTFSPETGPAWPQTA